jgi:hypothetical protein
MEATGITEWYRKGGVAVTENIAEGVVIDLLDTVALAVGDQA